MSQNANFPKLRPGAPLAAVTGAGYHNAIRDALKFVCKKMNASGRGFDALSLDSCVLLTTNDTGAVLPRFSVAGMTGPLFTPSTNLADFQNTPGFSLRVPTAADAGMFCITLDPMDVGASGRALFAGVVPVQINLGGSASPAFADVSVGQIGYLAPAASGAQVLWCDLPSSGNPWALVRLPAGGGGANPIVRATLATALVAGSSPDTYAQINILNPDDSVVSGGPFGALNTFIESGPAGAQCLAIVNTENSTNGSCPYILLRVVPVLMTTYQPGFDGSGDLTSTAQQFYGAGSSPVQSATTYTTAQAAGDDLQRDSTTTAVSVSSGTITYGGSVTLTATVSHSSGSGDPSGSVTFYWTPSGGMQIGLGSQSVSGGTATLTTSTIPAASGTGTITAVYGGDSNYNSSSGTASLTVNQAAVTVTLTATPASGTYGGSVALVAVITPPMTTISNGGTAADPSGFVVFKNGSTVIGPFGQYRVGAVSGGGMGSSYTIEALLTLTTLPAGTLSLSAVYQGDGNFSTATGTCSATVAQAQLTVTAQDATNVYGQPNPSFIATITGFVNSDTQATAVTGSPALSTTATSTSPVGSYAITAAAGTLAASNYSFTYVAGTLTVTPASLYVTADDKTMVHGGTLPAFTATLSGVVGSDSITASASCSADGSTAGSYVITPTASGSALSNYTVTYIQGTLTVT
jgi:hypothetical protein